MWFHLLVLPSYFANVSIKYSFKYIPYKLSITFLSTLIVIEEWVKGKFLKWQSNREIWHLQTPWWYLGLAIIFYECQWPILLSLPAFIFPALYEQSFDITKSCHVFRKHASEQSLLSKTMQPTHNCEINRGQNYCWIIQLCARYGTLDLGRATALLAGEKGSWRLGG